MTKDTKDLVVVDAMAIVHNIVAELNRMSEHPPLEPYIAAQMDWLGSGLWWSGFEGVSPDIALCWDSKPYWRQEYLLRDTVWRQITPVKRRKPQEPAPIHYKGGRAVPPTVLQIVKAYIKDRVERLGWHQLSQMANETHGYEADDLAALLVQVNRQSPEPRQIKLLTRDRDWMGLIGEEVTWICCNNDMPRVRDLSNYAATFRLNFQHPKDIWLHKSLTGDVSDNLPNCGGCPISASALFPVISLFNPPSEFNLLNNEQAVEQAKYALRTACPSCTTGNKAINALRRYGLYPCVNPIL